MIKNDELINKVFSVYRDRQLRASERALYINEQLNADKEFLTVRTMLRKVIYEIQKAEYENKSDDLNALYQKRDKLKKLQEQLLAKRNLTQADLSPRYVCEKCKDTGYAENGGLCPCFYKTLTQVINEMLDIEPRKLAHLSDFKAENEFDEKVKNLITAYVNSFPPQKIRNIIFTGSAGTGKTFSASIIANSLIERSFNVLFLTSIKLNDIFFNYHCASSGDRRVIYDLLTDCDLLIIDDLGTEPILKNITVEYLTSFLSERMAHEKPFIITTNLSNSEIQNRYTERLLSRLSTSETAIITVLGDDKRRLK